MGARNDVFLIESAWNCYWVTTMCKHYTRCPLEDEQEITPDLKEFKGREECKSNITTVHCNKYFTKGYELVPDLAYFECSWPSVTRIL